MAKKRSPRNNLPPPGLSEALRQFNQGKYNIYNCRLSGDGEMVDIYKDDALEERAIKVGLKSFVAGEKGGKQPKRRTGIEAAIREAQKKTPGISASALWNKLLRYGELKPLSIGGYSIYGGDDNNELVQIDDRSDSARYIRFRTFKDYFSRLKKETQ